MRLNANKKLKNFNCLIQSNVEVTVKTVNQLYNYSTVLGAAIKCKPYSEITVELGTHLKTVKITLNIFAVYITDCTRRSKFQTYTMRPYLKKSLP